MLDYQLEKYPVSPEPQFQWTPCAFQVNPRKLYRWCLGTGNPFHCVLGGSTFKCSHIFIRWNLTCLLPKLKLALNFMFFIFFYHLSHMPHPETLACLEVSYTKESPLHFGPATHKFSGPGQNAGLCQTKTGMASRPVYNRIYTHTDTKYLMSQASTIHVSLDIPLFHRNGPLTSTYSSLGQIFYIPLTNWFQSLWTTWSHSSQQWPNMCICYFPHCCILIDDEKQCKQAQLYCGLPLPFKGIAPLLQEGHSIRKRRNYGGRKRPSLLHIILKSKSREWTGSGIWL